MNAFFRTIILFVSGLLTLLLTTFTQHKSSVPPQRPPSPPSSDSDWRQRILNLINDTAGASKQPTPTRVVVLGYTRVSAEMQLTGDSLDDQAARIHAYILEQGWQTLEIITDPAFSGRNDRRPGWHRLIRLIKSGHVHVILVDRLDRIARNLGTLLEFVRLLDEHDIRLVSLRENIDFRTIWGKLTLQVLGGLAQFYSDNLSHEIHIKRLTDAQNGKLAPTHRFGFCKGNCSSCTDPNGPDYCPNFGGSDQRNGAFRIFHPIESHAVRLMFDWYATGRYSFSDIARLINAEIFMLPDGNEIQFRTKGKGQHAPGPFDADAVRAILSNAIYAGCVTFAGKTQDGKTRLRKPLMLFEGQHNAMVDPITFERVQHIRRGRFQRSSTVKTVRSFSLSRLLVCAHRHNPLCVSTTSTYTYYVDRLCQAKYDEHHQPNLRADLIASQVRSVVGQVVLPEEWIKRIIAYVIYDEGEDSLVKDRVALQRALEAEDYLLRQGVISVAEHVQHRNTLLKALEMLEPEASPISDEARALLDNLPTLLQSLDPQEENLLYRAIFSAIVVHGQEITAMEVFPPFVDLHAEFSLPGTHKPLLGMR